MFLFSRSVTTYTIITLLLATCSILYELIIAKTITILTGSAVLWQSITIGIYICALGLGTFTFEQKKNKNPLPTLIRTEIALSIIGALSVILILLAHSNYIKLWNDNYDDITRGIYSWQFPANGPERAKYWPFIFFILASQSVTALIGFFSGFEIPLLTAILQEKTNKNCQSLVLGFNYLGTLLGTLLFSFFLIPLLGLVHISVLVATVNLLICAFILSSPHASVGKRGRSAVLGVGTLIFFSGLVAPWVTQFHLKMLHYYTPNISYTRLLEFTDRMPTINRQQTLYQSIDIVEFPNSNSDQNFTLFLDGHYQFNSESEKYYHEGMAHIPFNLMGHIPENILVLGGGDGLLLRELLRYGPSIKSITHVELDPKMIKLSQDNSQIRLLNQAALSHPKIMRVIDDGFYFLRTHKEQFDAIFIDFPYPYNYDIAKLYSVEFYRFAQRRLRENGFIVVDAPLTAVNPKQPSRPISQRKQSVNSILLSTFHFAGFKTIFPYQVPDKWTRYMESFVLLTKKPTTLSFRFDLQPALFDVLTPTFLLQIPHQHFPHQIGSSHINTIFRPTLLSLTDETF